MNGVPDGLHTDDVGELPDRPGRHARDHLARLEIGSGHNPTPGFVHLDANPNTHPDILGSAYPLPAEVTECAPWDEIRAVDVLEHISYRDTDAALAEWARVLAPGGKLYVQTPAADVAMRWYFEAPGRLRTRLDECGFRRGAALMDGLAFLLMGGHADGKYVGPEDDWRWNAHYTLFSEGSLAGHLEGAGFAVESIEVNPHPNYQVTARRA